MSTKNNSPYTAAITGCSFLIYEFKRFLPLLMAENADKLIKEEIENNQILQVNSRKARRTFALEFKRRFNSVPIYFWQSWKGWSETGQRAGLFYAILKTYKLVFDFHFNVVVKKWRMAEQIVTKSDILMEINEISGKDDFVDSWSDKTKNKCAVHYITFFEYSSWDLFIFILFLKVSVNPISLLVLLLS